MMRPKLGQQVQHLNGSWIGTVVRIESTTFDVRWLTMSSALDYEYGSFGLDNLVQPRESLVDDWTDELVVRL